MKISIVVSLLILAVGASLGWRDRQQLSTLRTTQMQLTAEVVKLGTSSDPAQNLRRSTKRERATRSAATTKLSTADLIEQAKNGDLSGMFDGLSGSDPAGIKAVLAEAATDPDLVEQTRMLLNYACTTVLANDHPQAALEIFTSSSELFTGRDRGRSLVLTALSCLAKSELTKALGWISENPQHFPEDAKSEIISAVATQDPQHAFQLISELDFKISDYAIGQILISQKTLEAKSAALAGLREYLLTLPDEKARDQLAKSSITGLARSLHRESFDSATRWIAGENLTPQELGPLIEGLDFATHSGEADQWSEWMRQMPATQAAD